MKKAVIALLAAALTSALGACSMDFTKEAQYEPLISAEKRVEAEKHMRPALSDPYLARRDETTSRAVIPVKADSLELHALMALVLPDHQVVVRDAGVDLRTPVSIAAESMTLDKFLHTVGLLSGYELTLRGKNLEIASLSEKQWLLPAFAEKFFHESKVSGGSSATQTSNAGAGAGAQTTGGGGGTQDRGIRTTFTNEIDEWENVVATANRIMGGSSGTAGSPPRFDSTGQAISTPGSAGDQRVVAVRSQGLIHAYGPVPKLRQLDRWLATLDRTSTRQVRLSVRALEVSLNDSKSHGINWQAIVDRTFTNSTFQGVVGANFPGVSNPASPGYTIGATYTKYEDTYTALVNFLGQFGSVELQSEPQVTTVNGRTAYIGAGDEFGFVSSVTQTVTNGVTTLTPSTQRILIGVELAITPKLLDGDRIYVEIVPVVSNLNGFDNFTIGGNSFSQPRVSLQQLAVHAVVRSGESLPIGGLITSRLTKSLQTLPTETAKSLGVLGWALDNETNSLARRELLFVVTPTLVDS